MGERTVSVGCIAAYASWGVVAALLVVGIAVGLTGHAAEGLALCLSGVVVSTAAATVTVWRILARQSAQLRAAFELGRESRVSRLR